MNEHQTQGYTNFLNLALDLSNGKERSVEYIRETLAAAGKRPEDLRAAILERVNSCRTTIHCDCPAPVKISGT